MKRTNPQPALFTPPAQRHPRESHQIYGVVLRLRRSGSKVYRAGRHHIVDGTRLTTSELLQHARGLA